MNPVPPYVSLDIMRAMQRELYEEKWGPLGPYDGERTFVSAQEGAPDPIGLSIMRLRPVERVHALFGRVAHLVGRPAKATTLSATTEIARAPDGARDQCT